MEHLRLLVLIRRNRYWLGTVVLTAALFFWAGAFFERTRAPRFPGPRLEAPQALPLGNQLPNAAPADPFLLRHAPIEADREKVLSGIRSKQLQAAAVMRELGVCATWPAGIPVKNQVYCLSFALDLLHEFGGGEPRLQHEFDYMRQRVSPEVGRAFEEEKRR